MDRSCSRTLRCSIWQERLTTPASIALGQIEEGCRSTGIDHREDRELYRR